MFHVKLNSDKPASGAGIFPNPSHLHKMTSPGSQIPRKQGVKTSANGDVDIAVDSSIVSNFLKTMAAKENGTFPPKGPSQVYRNFGSKDIGAGVNGNQSQLHRPKENGAAPTGNQSQLHRPKENGAAAAGNPSHLHRTIGHKENGVSHLYKTQATMKVDPPVNKFGLKKVFAGGETVPSQFGLRKVDTNAPLRKDEVLTRTRSDPDKCKEVRVPEVTYSRTPSVEGESAKWKAKYEDTEKKRKELVAETQRTMRDKNSLEKQLEKLQSEYQSLSSVCNDRTQQLDKLRKVSELVYQDYDTLNMKYETETTTLHKALEVASKWYKQNKKLKRESVALRSGAKLQGLDDVVDGEPEEEPEDQQDELAELRKTVQDLSGQVGQLQAELNRARLQEFEAQEQFINLTQQLDEEKSQKERLQEELRGLRLMKEKFESVTYMVKDEMEALRTERNRAKETATRLQEQAHQAVKERNVLAHQSTLLMGDLSSDEKLMKLLQEVDGMQRKLDDEKQKHALEMQEMERRLEERESEAQMELLEEKLKLAESELQLALQRADTAERTRNALNSKVSELESQLGGENSGLAPPPPPPPLPPPMPFMDNMPCIKPQRVVKKNNAAGDSLEDMANLLGIQRQPKPTNGQGAAGGAIDDIINEIKGGKFILKATEKQKLKKEEPPPAVQEMLSIIGTLKRRPKNTTSRPPPDVQL